MNDDLRTLKKIIGKTFRKAKCWYRLFILCQLAVLVVAITSIFSELGVNLCALIALIGVIISECFRWTSDEWKSEGEWAKRKLEMAEGFGEVVDNRDITNWLADRSETFLDDVRDEETQGSDFDSPEMPGARRALQNTEESAWWSKFLCRRMVFYLGFILGLVLVTAVAALVFSIGALNTAEVKQSGAAIHKVGGIICSVFIFVCSINVFRLLADYLTFARDADAILIRCVVLYDSQNLTERNACAIMHDYNLISSSLISFLHGASIGSPFRALIHGGSLCVASSNS
ncbi:MAG: hypothetical protein ABSB84_16075 [Verrucomicrobiota bacterium]|jgi:hypothetical protein